MNMNSQMLASYKYDLGEIKRGYTDRTLYIDITNNIINSKPVSDTMKDVFVGGKGFGLWLLWQAISGNTNWYDPENELVISSGPLGGVTQFPGSGKSIVVTISPTTHTVVDSNVGGYFGPYLKFAGWDALEIQGKASKNIIIYIDGFEGVVEIYEASTETEDTYFLLDELLEMYAEEESQKRLISSVTAGPGSDHTLIGCLNVSFFDTRRNRARIKQAGRGGTGTVFRDKHIRAIVVKSPPFKGDILHPADLKRIQAVGKKMNQEIAEQDPIQNQIGTKGTTMLVDILNYHDLLPVNNFKFGSHPDADHINADIFLERFTEGLPDGCWYGCTLACSHAVKGFKLRTGPYQGKSVCIDGPEYETIGGVGSNCGIFNPDDILEINFYCDNYGIDVISFGTLTAFIMECYEAGILNSEITGGLELSFGNGTAALELLHQMSRGEGFGKIAGQGIRIMKAIFVEQYAADAQFLQDIGMEAKGMEYSEYVTKESLAQQGGYGLANKGPQHDEAWLISMDSILNLIPSIEEKAEALHYFPMWRTWFSLNGLCKIIWNDVEPADNKTKYSGIDVAKVPEHVQNYVDLFVGVTGREDVTSGEDLIKMSEAVYNFQRVFNFRMGFGMREDDAIPYRSVGPVTEEEYLSRQERYDRQLEEMWHHSDLSKKITKEKLDLLRTYREEQYEQLIDAVYKRRGWTNEGIPTNETLKRLKIDFPEVLEVVNRRI
jgi:aldehyde:ferredoxin oxidoreductase